MLTADLIKSLECCMKCITSQKGDVSNGQARKAVNSVNTCVLLLQQQHIFELNHTLFTQVYFLRTKFNAFQKKKHRLYLLLSELCDRGGHCAEYIPDRGLCSPYHACHPLNRDKWLDPGDFQETCTAWRTQSMQEWSHFSSLSDILVIWKLQSRL